MDLNSKNQRKKNKKNFNSFNMSNATKTFKKLVEKHNKEQQLRNKKVYYNKTDEFFNSLNNIFFKEEIKETDLDYIFKEIKNQIKVNQTLIDHFGINATKKIMPYSREPVKFDKKLLFNPLKSNEQNQVRYASFDNSKNKEEKYLTLPSILKKNFKIINPRKNSEQFILLKKLESTKDFKFNEIKSLNKYNKLKTDSSNFNYSNTINNNSNNYNNTFSNDRYAPIGSYNFFTKTNNNLSQINNKGSNNNSSTFTMDNKSSLTLGNKTNLSFDKNEYLLTLDNLKDQIRHNQRRNRLYFKSNDYGCELSKDKYNYITKNFFN